MNRVNLREARSRLSQIVDAAKRGESIVITRRGRDVARVEPPAGDTAKVLPDLTAFRSSIRRTGKPLSEAVMHSRRRERA